jgi:hypothetical protein
MSFVRDQYRKAVFDRFEGYTDDIAVISAGGGGDGRVKDGAASRTEALLVFDAWM